MKKLFLCMSAWSLLAGFSGCVVKEEEYPHHHYHHDRVYIEERRPVVEERVEVK